MSPRALITTFVSTAIVVAIIFRVAAVRAAVVGS